MAASSTLLRGGVIIEHGVGDALSHRKADILIEGNTITKIKPLIETQSANIEVIDCQNKLISPGMINTHQHTWQTQLKGRHADHVLTTYMITGNYIGALYKSRDIELGQLCGALESIDAGTTTIVDHFQAIDSEDHFRAGADGLAKSGIRAVWCPSIVARAKTYLPDFTLKEMEPSWFMPLFDEHLSKEKGDGRILQGLAHDGVSAVPKDDFIKLIEEKRKQGVQLFTFHSVGSIWRADPIASLSEYGLLGPDMLFSHATNMTGDQMSKIVSTGAKISCTPSTELHMGLGETVVFKDEVTNNCSLGVDCHSFVSASILSEAKLGLAWERGKRAQSTIAKSQLPETTLPLMHAAFNQATIQGARAVGLENQIGSIAVGKKADLVIWDTLTPSMAPVAKHDPITALVMHSTTRDVHAVMVDGILRKNNGKLLPALSPEGSVKEWHELASDLMNSYDSIQAKSDEIDYDKAKMDMFKAWSGH